MKRVLRYGIVTILGLTPILGHCMTAHAPAKVRVPPDDLSGAEARTVELYQRSLPTVVTITTSQGFLTEEGPMLQRGAGSGVLISTQGDILTAAHVVQGAENIIVTTYDGQSGPATVVYSEPSADVALVKLVTPATELPHARLGDSDRLAVGQSVYVIGSPLGLENSLSVGHISGFREFDRLYDGAIVAEFIQTDAAINVGNSGGPVFNSKGEVIGIASLILTQSGGFEGLGFAVAINTAKQLLSPDSRPWIGVEAIFLEGEVLAGLLNLDVEGGLLVQRVAKGSPAEKAGLRGGSIPAQILGLEILLGGDLILEFNTQETCHKQCLIDAAKRLPSGDQIPVKFLRKGKIMRTIVDVPATRRSFKESAEDE